MSYMRDHMHEVEIRVEGVVVHVHGLMFVGVPGEVTVRHRSRPVQGQQAIDEATPDQSGEWGDYDPEAWGWDDTP